MTRRAMLWDRGTLAAADSVEAAIPRQFRDSRALRHASDRPNFGRAAGPACSAAGMSSRSC